MRTGSCLVAFIVLGLLALLPGFRSGLFPVSRAATPIVGGVTAATFLTLVVAALQPNGISGAAQLASGSEGKSDASVPGSGLAVLWPHSGPGSFLSAQADQRREPEARLMALNARTGKPCEDFEEHGFISLTQYLGHVPDGFHFVTPPPMIISDLVITGGWIFDNQATFEPSGAVRAFDPKLGLVYLPDYFGGQANPMSYMINGKQYIVIAAGGHAGMGTRTGDYILAYALDDGPTSQVN